jgi:hypothetical protein
MNVAQKSESTDLAVVQKLTPAVVFAPGGVQDILDKITREVRSAQTDISTKAGREAVASLAYKVARSKTALDEMGKTLVADWKTKSAAVDAERRTIREKLDELKDEVRKPLTDWENAEKQRIADHEDAIVSIERMTQFDGPVSAADIKCRIDALANRTPRQWQEFVQRASESSLRVGKALEDMHDIAVKREAEAAELARFRAEQIAREQKERDDKIAAEAAERARIEAETKAKREADEAAAKAETERKRVEQERADAIARAERAEADRKAAAAKAEQDAKDAAEAAERKQAAAIEAERKRIADDAAREARETTAREANIKHRTKINNEVLAALEQILPSKDLAKAVVTAIAKGEIPHTRIGY